MVEHTYTDLTIEDFPEGAYEILWPLSFRKNAKSTNDYYVQLAIRNLLTKEPTIIEKNIKEIAALPLGGIIRDKNLTEEKSGELYTFDFSVNTSQTSTTLPGYFISDYTPYFNSLSSTIKLFNKFDYNLNYYSKRTKGIELYSRYGDIIFFPAFIIAQYYYFRSASLIRQIMSGAHKHPDAIKSLYKEISDDRAGNVEIILPFGASPADAAEILRFAVDPYANKLFNNIFSDLFHSHLHYSREYNRRGYEENNIASLQTYFPFEADVRITFRGIKLTDNYFLALEIVEENSPYPFEKLTIYTENPYREDQPIKVGQIIKKLSARNITGKLSGAIPNSRFEDMKISNGIKHDGRLDLIGKIIINEKIAVKSKSEILNINENFDEGVNLSADHAECSGDKTTIQMNPAYKGIEPSLRKIPNLEDFKNMLYVASKKNEKFSYVISGNLPFPQKPKDDCDSKRWLRAFLKKDNITPRAFQLALINFNGCIYTILEVEKDNRIPKISTLILKMNDHTKVPNNIVRSILIDYIKEEKAWLHAIVPIDYEYITLIHPHDSTSKNINGWAARLLDTLSTF